MSTESMDRTEQILRVFMEEAERNRNHVAEVVRVLAPAATAHALSGVAAEVARVYGAETGHGSTLDLRSMVDMLLAAMKDGRMGAPPASPKRVRWGTGVPGSALLEDTFNVYVRVQMSELGWVVTYAADDIRALTAFVQPSDSLADVKQQVQALLVFKGGFEFLPEEEEE